MFQQQSAAAAAKRVLVRLVAMASLRSIRSEAIAFAPGLVHREILGKLILPLLGHAPVHTVMERRRAGSCPDVRQPLVPRVPSSDLVCEAKQLVHDDFLTFHSSLSLCAIRSKLARQWGLVRRCARVALLGTALVASVHPANAADGTHSAATSSPQNVFAAALVDGYAATPAPVRSPAAVRVLESLQAQSGSKEPISLVAQRVVRFTQQSRCGRVRFALAQPAAKKVWPAFGGQMNVCEDGQPPLRTCPERQSILVPATSVCASGKPPVDTEEVAAAIRAATSAGAITHDQMLHDWFQKINAHSHAPLTSSPSSAAGVAHAGAAK